MSYIVPQKQVLGDLKTYVEKEMSQNNTLTHGKLQRCQTRRSNSRNHAALCPLTIAIVWSMALLYFKFLLKTQYEVPFINTSEATKIKFLLITQYEVPFINTREATKRLSDPTENGKCANVTNRRSHVGCGQPHFTHHSPKSTLKWLSPVLPLV